MPIHPDNAAKYPPDWPAISRRIRFERAEGRCECRGQCGLHRGRRCIERHGEPATYARGKIVLTTAHRDHDEANCADDNLFAACQRCHLRYDRQHHKTSALKRQGQGALALEEAGS